MPNTTSTSAVAKPRRRNVVILVIAVSCIVAGAIVYQVRTNGSALPAASWEEAEDGAKRAVVDRDKLVEFYESVGLSEVPPFERIDPILSARIYQLLRQIADNQSDSSLFCRMGELYQRHDFPEAARSAYERAIALNDRYEYHYLLALVELAEGRIDEGFRHLRRTLELNPDYSAADYHLAEQLFNSGELDEAEIVYDRLTSSKNAASGYVGLAVVAMARNDVDQAQLLLEKALKLDPQHYRAHYQLALLYQRQGNTEGYERHFGRYQSLPHRISLEDPLYTGMVLSSVTPPLVREVVDDLNQQGRDREALAILGTAIQERPRSPILWRQLAITQGRLKRFNEALESVERCLSIDRHDVHTLTTKSRICLALGRWDDAMESALLAITEDPSRAESYFLCGQALRGQGDLAKAVTYYEKASDTDPDNFTLAVALAESCFMGQRYEEAKVAFLRADRVMPGDPRIQNRLDQIEQALSGRMATREEHPSAPLRPQ